MTVSSHGNNMQKLSLILCALSALTTVVIELVMMSMQVSTTTLSFLIWGVSPYALLIALIKAAKSSMARISAFVITLVTGSWGIVVIINAMFIHPDPQGGLVFLFIPFWQWLFLLLSVLPVLWLNKVNKHCKR